MKRGETWFGLVPKKFAIERLSESQHSSGGISLPVAPPQSFGVTDPHQVAYVKRMLTPHPVATCTTPLQLEGEVGNGLPVHYIACTDPPYEPAAGAHERARAEGWPITEFATGHAAMVIAPQETADLLDEIASRR